MKKILSYYLMLVIIVFALVKCDHAEDLLNVPGNIPNDNDGTLTDDERIAVLDACDVKATALNNLKSINDKVQFIAWLFDEGDFYSAGFAGNDVYAVFNDGRVAFFVNTPKTDEPTGGRIANNGRRESDRSVNKGDVVSNDPDNSDARAEDLPKSKKVMLFNGMGKYFDDNTVAIQNIFNASKTKYEVERKPASVANLKTVAGVGVFYIFTHGGAGSIPIPNTKDSLAIMSLWTTDAVDKNGEGAYKSLLDQKKLAYMRSTYDSDKPVWHYGFTSEFVKTEMSFGENCIIYVDACNSFRDNEKAEQYRADVMGRAGNGQATYIGWSFETNALFAPRASQFIFDRLLGANTTGSNPGIPKEDPIQRPFDLAPVMNDVSKRGYDVCANGATLMYATTTPDEILLRPSIQAMDIEESTSTLYIFGLFGQDPGTVTVDDVSAVVTSWTTEFISCIIPEQGSGSVGDVIVVSPLGHKSNPVPLTEWLIKVNYTSDDNKVVLSGVATLRFRGDVHPSRKNPHETPERPKDQGFGNGGPFNAKGSSATYSIKGQKLEICTESDGCTYKYTETVTPKSGTVDFVKFPSTSPGLVASYAWNADHKSIYINVLSISHPDTKASDVTVVTCPDTGEHTSTFDNDFGSAFIFPLLPQSNQSFKFEIADNYNIRPGSVNQSKDKRWQDCDNSNAKFKITASWEVTTPTHAPTDQTPARGGS